MRRPLVLRWRDWPWAVKLGTLLVTLVILPLTIVTIVAEASARRDGFADSRARNLQRARTTAALIDQYLDDIVADLQILALSPATIRVLRRQPAAADAGELQATLANLQKLQRIETLFVLDQDGTVVASTDDALLNRNRISAPFFLSAIAGQILVHPPRYLADEQAIYINVSVPVRDAATRVLGVAAARISLVDITRLVGGDTGFGGLGEFGILWDAGGIVISSPARPHLEFRPLATLLPFTRDRLIAERRFGPDTAVLLASGTGAEALVERSRWQHYDNQIDPHTSVDLGGGTLHVTSVPLLENRWTYGVGVPAANVTAAVRAQSRRNLAAALGTALLAIVLAVTAAGRLSRPLSHIAETARALASGEMSRRAHLARRDEIGRLAAAFDSMADALAEKDQELRRHAESLERRVEERTTELRGLLTAIPDLMFKVDRDGRLIDYVAAKDTDLALPPEQFLGRHLSEVMPPEITSPAMAAIQAALEGRTVNGFEYRLALGGDPHHFEARVSATGTDAVVFLVRDITERRRGEERARFLARAGTTLASSLDYSNTVETLARMSVPFLADVCVVDLLEHGRFRCAAVAAATPEQEALVHAVRQRHPLDFAGDPLAPFVLRAGPVLHHAIPPDPETSPDTEPPDWREEDAAMLRAAGATSAITVPLVARGQLLGVMSLAAASTDRKYDERDVGVAEELAKRAAIALDNARLYREVQESSRLKDEFLGIVSHELRTPLNAVLGWSQVLRRGKIDDDQAARALDAIDRNARAQARLVDDLLDTSRVVSGKLRIDIAQTAVASVVLNAADSFAPLARARGVELETRVAPDVGCIPADANRLQQVVGNLLANALKFTPPGGHVEVAVAPAGPFVETDAESLASRLRDRGARPVVVPTIAIAELGPGGRLDAVLPEIGAFGWIVVTSANGARALFRRLRALSIEPPEGPRWAAVGPATAAALEAEGVRVERVPRAGTGVAIADVLGDLAGVRVLLPRARIAGRDLPSALIARGARVDDVPAYDTVIGPESSRVLLAQALDEGLEAAVFTSGSTVEGFFRLAADPRRALSMALTVCIGRPTARALREAGVEPSAVAASPSPAAIVEALEREAHARA